MDEALVGKIRGDLFRELAALNATNSVNGAKLASCLNNHLIRSVIQTTIASRQPAERAVPKLLHILKERALSGGGVPEASSVGVLHLKRPKHHDNRIIVIFARNTVSFAEMYSEERAISLALLQIETAFKEDTRCVDLVVDFTKLAADGFGMRTIRKLITELASYHGFCKRVFFVDFPDEYRAHCEDWREKLPRDFRRRVWCVAPGNLP